MNHRAWIDAIRRTPDSVSEAISRGLAAVGRSSTRGQRWAVKLNLTYPTYLPGVVNSPVFIEGLCRWAGAAGVRLTLIEGNGGNNWYSALDAFEGNGVIALAARYGATCHSLSKEPWEWRVTRVGQRSIRLPYSPFFTSRDFDVLVTAPVFKNHIFTNVSLGMKNLWGCIPDAYRMYYHAFLDDGIVALVKELQPDVAIFDGLTALRGRGPMDGSPVEMDCLMVGSTVGAGEAAALTVMGVGLDTVRHLRLACDEKLMPEPRDVAWLTDWQRYGRTDFIVTRSWLNRLSIAASRSPKLQRVIYHSPVSRTIYRVVEAIRPASPQARLARQRARPGLRSQ